MSGRACQTTPPRTLGNVDKRANGFDTIRLIAAVAVILSHAYPLTGGQEPLEALSRGQASIGHLAVCVFFLISGFLIPASLDRGNLARYVRKRALRILPALAVAVGLCALVLGALVTSLPLAQYYRSSQTWLFLGHAVFLPVGFDLPDVFTDLPDSAVNGSLWSLKFEVACYVFVPLVFMFARWRVQLVLAVWLASFVLARAVPEGAGGLLYHLGMMAKLFRFFGAGMLLYLVADRIPLRSDWALAATVACVLALFTPFFVETIATAGVYAIIFFAFHAPPGFRRLTARGDISYGVYLYAFPIQQLLVPVSLELGFAGLAMPWLTNFALALPATLVAGALSWILIEKPLIARSRNHEAKPVLS